MDESSLQTLWQEQPIDAAVPSELALKLTVEPAVDVARPTTLFRSAAAAPKKSRSLLFAFAAVFAIGVFGIAWQISKIPAEALVPVTAVAPPDTTPQLIENALAECRTYSNTEAGLVDWDRARAACQRVLELEPIHAEANALTRRIAVLKTCEADFNGAKEQLAMGRLETALEKLGRIHKGCESYLLRSLSLAKPIVEDVTKQTAKECLAYAKAREWSVALPRCEVYARYACQSVDPVELYPPALMKLKLDGSLNPKSEWRPRDPAYLMFLKAREKVGVHDQWRCPELIALRPPPAAPDPSRTAVDELSRRYAEPELDKALISYFKGDLASATVPVQKVLENMGKAQHHAEARELLLDMNAAINLYENGTAEITNDRPDKAETPFLKALEVDERLVLGERAAKMSLEERKKELDRRVSFIRKSIVETMSSTAYEKGKGLADRKDFRAACKMWKLGNEFSRSNIDLLKALTNVCTRRAQDLYERAESCAQLSAVLDFAVDGDGFKEKTEKAMSDGACP